MNAPPGFESDPEEESESEDDSPTAVVAPKDTPKFSWKALVKEPGTAVKPRRKLTLSSWMPSTRPKPQSVIEGLNDALNDFSPPASPSKLKKHRPPMDPPTPSLEDLESFLQDSPSSSPELVETRPTAQQQVSQPSTAQGPTHSAELDQFLDVLGQFLTQRVEASQQSSLQQQQQSQQQSHQQQPYQHQHFQQQSQQPPSHLSYNPYLSPQNTSQPSSLGPQVPLEAQHRPTWIPTHEPTIAACNAYWAGHPPLPTWPQGPGQNTNPGIGSPRTPLPAFSSQPPTPGHPPPFYPHPASLLPYHPQYGENNGYYAAPISPDRLHQAEQYLPNPWSPTAAGQRSGRAGPSGRGTQREDGHIEPRSRAKGLVKRMMGQRIEEARPTEHRDVADRVASAGDDSQSTLHTIMTCIGIAKELRHSLSSSKGSSKNQRIQQTLSALHKLIDLLRHHKAAIGSRNTMDGSGNVVEDIFRYLKGFAQYITPGLVVAVIYLVKDWLQNGFSVKGLLKSATSVLEELNRNMPMIQHQVNHPQLAQVDERILQQSVQSVQAQPPRPPSPARRASRPPALQLSGLEASQVVPMSRASSPSPELTVRERHRSERPSRRDRSPPPSAVLESTPRSICHDRSQPPFAALDSTRAATTTHKARPPLTPLAALSERSSRQDWPPSPSSILESMPVIVPAHKARPPLRQPVTQVEQQPERSSLRDRSPAPSTPVTESTSNTTPPHKARPPPEQVAAVDRAEQPTRYSRSPSPASTISYLDLDSVQPSSPRMATIGPAPSGHCTRDITPQSAGSTRSRDTAPLSAGPSGTRTPANKPVISERAERQPLAEDPLPSPVPPPRSMQRPSQSATDALKAKQKREYERLKRATTKQETVVHLRRVGDLPEEVVTVHDGTAELDEGETEVKPDLKRVESDLQATRELAHADSGPAREPVAVDVEEKDELTSRQIEEAKDVMRRPTPLRGVKAAENVHVEPLEIIRDADGEPEGVQAETIIDFTESAPASPLLTPWQSPLASPGPSSLAESPSFRPPLSPYLEPLTPLETPGGSPLVFPVFGSELLDMDDIRDEVEDSHEMERLRLES